MQVVRVYIDYYVVFNKHYYSVPYTLMGKEVEVRRVMEKMVEIYYQRQMQAVHPRSFAPGRYSTRQDHMSAGLLFTK